VSVPIVEIREPGRVPLRLQLVGPLVIGRDCDGLLLTDQQISRRHVELRPARDGAIEVFDLASSNGTFVDGRRLTTPTTVRPLEEIRLGSSTITLLAPTVAPHDADPRATMVPGDSGIGRMTSIDHVVDLVIGDSARGAVKEHREGTITIVFSDIVGSTERVTSVGDDQWVAVLGRHNGVIREAVRRYGGTEVKSQGDGFMLSFSSARRAVQAMTAVQMGLRGSPIEVHGVPLQVRIGMHTGEVIVDDDGDLYGHHVHTAARVAGHSEGGEILVSALTKAILETRSDINFGESRLVTFRGISGAHEVHPVVWSEAL
jgi:class 3 adenylate cyclase